MKRRSMLGRRQSRMLQSPSAPASNVRPPPPTRNAPHTPEQQSGLFENPFRTPSVNGSLSEVGENDNAWSVFKSVRHGLKTPPEQEPANQFRNPLKSLNNRETSIKNNGNRKREQKNYEKIASVLAVPSATTRKFQISVYKHQLDQSYLPPVKQNDDQPFRSFSGHSATAPEKTADDNDTSFRSNGLSQPMKAFEFSFQKNDRGADAGGPKIVSMPVVHEEKSRMDVNTPASPWDHQDIRNLSPPWSNGLNTISDFNLLTPQNSKRAASSPLLADSRSSSLSNSMAYPLEATVLENTVVQVEVTPEAKTAAQPGNEVIGDEKLDVKTALSEVSLGVDSIDLLDTHGMGEWSSTSWTSRTVLRRVSEELEETLVEEKENKPHPIVTPPQDEEPMEEQMSQLSNGSVLSPSQGTSSASKSSEKRIKSHLEKLIDLNSRIEEAEDERDSAEQRIRQLEEQIHLAIEDRRSAEDKRRKLEYKRKMLNYELLEGMSEAPSIFAVQSSKRRKIGPPSAKKGPSFVATKLLKRDFARTPVRTPRRSVANSSMSMNSFINPFTPKTLRKNINDQYDQIFGN